MRSAKEEFLKLVEGKEVLCATISRELFPYDDTNPTYNLPVGFNEDQYASFLEEICFNYDNGYGGQELFGNVWFKDGTWADRGEYDGSEWWSLQTMPEIPKKLMNNQKQ